MIELHETHPVYGFAAHKGYSTAAHQAADRRARPVPRAPVQLRQRARPQNGASRTDRTRSAGDTAAPIVGQNGEGSAQAAQGDLLDFGAIAGDRFTARLDFRGARE